MGVYTNDNGVWKSVLETNVKILDTYRQCTGVYTKDSGVWRTVYPVVGEVAFGGLYIGDYNGYRMILSPLSGGHGSPRYWKTSRTTTGVYSTTNGYSNTYSMNNTSHPSARFCATLTVNGYTDWYLPSSGELAFLVSKKAIIQNDSVYAFTEGHVYWSSTEYNAGNSRSHHYNLNTAYTSQDKMSNQYTRAIRRVAL